MGVGVCILRQVEVKCWVELVDCWLCQPGVAYQSTARDCLIGDSDKSWAVGFLASEDGKLCCFHNKKKKRLTLQMTSSAKAVTVGTLLDLDDGYVAFFLSELNQHLHSFKARLHFMLLHHHHHHHVYINLFVNGGENHNLCCVFLTNSAKSPRSHLHH